jgi:hypothetical protein
MIEWNDFAFEGRDEIAIYGLIDPTTRVMRYVGQTVNPEARYKQHVTLEGRQCNPDKTSWIYSVLAEGLLPTMYIFGIVPKKDAYAIEMVTIYIVKGRLTNHVQPTEKQVRKYLDRLNTDARWQPMVAQLTAGSK